MHVTPRGMHHSDEITDFQTRQARGPHHRDLLPGLYSRHSPLGTLRLDPGPLSPDPADRHHPVSYFLHRVSCCHPLFPIRTMAVAGVLCPCALRPLARLRGLRPPYLLRPGRLRLQDTRNWLRSGGQGRIRTFEGVSQQIYSLPRLTASVPTLKAGAEGIRRSLLTLKPKISG